MILEVVVASSPPIVVALLNYAVYEALSLGLAHQLVSWEEAILEVFQALLASLEARQVILSKEHHLDEEDDFLSVLLQSHESLLHQLTELVEAVAVVSTEHFHLLLSQLEWSLLELDSFARGVGEEEAKVDVHDMAFDIQHDVSVVPVLDLEDVAHETVGGERAAKVGSSLLERPCLLASKLVQEEVHDPSVLPVELLFDCTDGLSIIADFDETAPLARCQNLVRFEPQIELLGLEDLVKG